MILLPESAARLQVRPAPGHLIEHWEGRFPNEGEWVVLTSPLGDMAAGTYVVKRVWFTVGEAGAHQVCSLRRVETS